MLNSTIMAHKSRRPEGVAIMVKNHLNPIEGPQIEAEMLWCCVTTQKPTLDQILDKICCAIDNGDTQNVILMGDFNFRNIN